jgi:hypothetical protein
LIFDIDGDGRGDRAPAVTFVGCWAKASFDAAAALTVKLLLVALVNAPSAALIVYAPAVVIERLLNVATPLTAATVSVPPSVPGPLAMDSVTLDVLPVTMFPN